MGYQKRQRTKILLNFLLNWIILFVIFGIIRGLGTVENGAVELLASDKILLTFLFGGLVGVLSGLAQIFLEEKLDRNLRFTQIILFKSLSILTLSIVTLICSFLYFKSVLNRDLPLVEVLTSPTALSIILFLLIGDIFLSFIRKVDQMLGANTLNNLMRGKYYRPRKEERIFMFLDLKGSTTIAEQLGFEKYSFFIQDCLSDLSVVMDYEAEIYQYVGDEAVLTWKTEPGLKDQNCLHAFFSFRDLLKEKRDYYLNKYETSPTFKAGMHIGLVMVTEVGRFKKEIAYHGDTINTAARIQGQCNNLNTDFIVSERLKNRVDIRGVLYQSLGSIQLRGKEKETGLYSADLAH
ncbi:MAG: adenylate/guanylate cyclase domain-containing protein [Bacteroidota bacterium]